MKAFVKYFVSSTTDVSGAQARTWCVDFVHSARQAQPNDGRLPGLQIETVAVHRISQFIAFFVILAAPLPFGSVDLVWVWIWTALLVVSLATAELSRVCYTDLWVLGSVAVILLFTCTLAVFQIWPGVSLELASPAWEVARKLAGLTLPDRLSVTASVPWVAFGPCLLFALAFARAYLIATDEEAARSLLKATAYAGFAYAVYGIAAQLFVPTKLLWRTKEYYLAFATGTFVNRNTAAAFWGCCAVLFLGQLLALSSHTWFAQRGPRRVQRSFVDHPIALCAGLLACLTAVGMTGSRAGVLLTLLGLAFLANLQLMQYRDQLKRYWLVAGMVALAAIVVFFVIGGMASSRVGMFGMGDPRRLEVYRTTLEMLTGHELFGWGLGNFESAFPAFRTADLGSQGIWDKAHSTPLEMLVSAGIPLTVLVCGLAVFFFGRMSLGSFARRRDNYMPATGAAVFLLGALHSCVDFSVQVTGFAVLFAAIVGCGLAQSISTLERPPRH
ncbi:O-antigen ligase family protein [Bradyrhizobium monzae]|uniref:O-antigen ligase family protein n=1 Tax=Bradyrhizobium sp. Oc8 TaxID=2876780 RepID=UPI001F2636DB|nr:O-antigen ligase family protein [Bradyrhizobium sp. Oc8]